MTIHLTKAMREAAEKAAMADWNFHFPAEAQWNTLDRMTQESIIEDACRSYSGFLSALLDSGAAREAALIQSQTGCWGAQQIGKPYSNALIIKLED
ncbi:hypothetical protein [Aestuariivirga sp.]|uniref:hypothetical protein n=1 Tax=Aestuariivirga sp. TaxID=2650926 RepID=UPI0039E6C890